MFKQASEKRVAVFVAPGLEEIEGLTVVDLLFRAGIPCDTVAITPERTVTSSHEVTIVCKRSLFDEDFSFDDYDMLVLPGGIPGTPNLRACAPLCEELAARAAAGRPLAAICAAPSILAELGLLEGRRATSNPGFQHVLAEHGAVLLADEPVVVDANLITSQGAGTAMLFALEIVRHYLGDEAVGRVREGVVLR
ncbi:DJ-1 family glyoxalase III [Thermophilibacter provencensis]|uniref:DJ-1/PfpI family protein n=1 Tax=Thermophilibacter provencensis TaxID=1852386 RepID=A0A921GEU3_9ACTN|nr:DJ-1 family glyoxalase III [Thermophilibacter provencensis]HJF44930.1 DJ-1/PfpI family protein [Thermophilibacter provencensis]